MKLNWGHGIVGAFIFFMACIVYLVVGCFGTNVDLVTKDYYQQELVYQETIDATKNMKSLVQQPTLMVTTKGLLIELPVFFKGKELSGAYRFYRPNDKSRDFELPIGPDEEMKQLIPFEMLGSGKWRVKMKVEQDGKSFAKEEIVII